MLLDTALFQHLSDLVITCDLAGRIAYANAASRRWGDEELVGQPFTSLLMADAEAKGLRFLEAARAAGPGAPTEPWELTVGSVHAYQVGRFRGYRDGDDLVVVGQIEPEQVGALQQELLALTSELTQAQRDLHRQNRALQQAINDQRHLIETINDLSTPAIPVWEGVLLLPLVGHLDSHRSQQIVEALLRRVSAESARYVILDVSGIATVDTAVVRQLIDAGSALRLLGATPLLVGINPEIAQTIVHLGVQLTGLLVHATLQSALASVIRQRPQPGPPSSRPVTHLPTQPRER